MMKNRVHGIAGIAVAIMVTVVYSTPGFAWYYFASAEDRIWEEISTERKVLAVGTIVSALPNGARSIIIEQTQYFVSGENWFLPIIDKEGIRFQVVFAPV